MKNSTSRIPVYEAGSAILLTGLFLVGGLITGHGQPFNLPTRHVWAALSDGSARWRGHMASTERLQLHIALPLRNQGTLDQFLDDLYRPGSPNYRQFLTVAEFADRFGPTEADYETVIRFTRTHQLTVTGLAANRMVVDVEGSVYDVEHAFNVTLNRYEDLTTGREFYAPDREPRPDLSTPLWHISGLDNYSVPHPQNLHQKAEARPKATGTGPHGEFLGSDFRAAYYGAGELAGAGQSVGLVEFGGYNFDDVTNYFTTVGQPLNVTVTPVSTDGSPTSCTQCDDSEQTLDIEVAISMAPAMDQVLVYVARESDVDLLNRMATDNLAKSLSCSRGWSPADPRSDEPIFKEFAAQGQTMFVASGDAGAFDKKSRFVYPADDRISWRWAGPI